MKVLVTGASGFVGSTLADELVKQGHEVRILVRRSSNLRNLTSVALTPVEGDLRHPESLEQAIGDAEIVFHVAGVVTAPDREAFFASNAKGTENLVRAVNRAPSVRRMVYVSSLAAAGPGDWKEIRREENEAHPVSDYGASKLAGEKALEELKTSSVVVRPPAVYGPKDRGVLTFFEIVERGLSPKLGATGPDRLYSFVHVEDLVRGIILAGTSEEKFSPGEVFYISGDGEHSWSEVMRLLAESMGKDPVTVPLPLPLLKLASGLCSAVTAVTGKALPLSLDKYKELSARSWACSNEKAKRRLGFKPYWSLPQGFRQTARWYRENGWL